MHNSEDKYPGYNKQVFLCPFCKAISKQRWIIHVTEKKVPSLSPGNYELATSKCDNCSESTIWRNGEMIYPQITGLPAPHPQMPKEISDIYNEAASIYKLSQRASLALLRLAIDQMTSLLLHDTKSDNLFNRIAILKSRNIINQQIQNAFDIFRITGNKAIHPGEINSNDNITHAPLFEILNYIIEVAIAKPKQIKEIYDEIPEDQKKAIEDRNKKHTNL